MFEIIQVGEISLREKQRAIVSRWSLVVGKHLSSPPKFAEYGFANDHQPTSAND
jgi:hypothetical protein